MKNLNQYLLSLLFVNIFFGISSGQNIDSLRKVYLKSDINVISSLKDTSHLGLYNALGRYYQGASPDSAFIIHRKAIKLIKNYLEKNPKLRKDHAAILNIKLGEATRQLGWDYVITGNKNEAEKNYSIALKLGIASQNTSNKKIKAYGIRLQASALCNIGAFHDTYGEHRKAILVYRDAMHIASKIDNASIMTACMGNLGNSYWNLGDLDSAIYYTQKSIPVFKKIKNEVGLANAYYMVSQIYDDKGDYAKALEYLFKALKLGEKIGNKRLQGNIYNSIGIIYYHQSQSEKSLSYFEKSIQLSEEIKDDVLKCNAITNIAILHLDKNDFNKAINNYKDVITIAKQIDNKTLLAKNYGNIGNVYEKMGDLKTALEYYLMGEEMSLFFETKGSLAKNKMNIGSIYLKTAQYSKAENYFKSSLQIGKESDNIEIIKDVNMHLSQLYELTNKPLLSLNYYKQYITLRDSILKVEDIKSTMQQELQFEYSKKATADSVAQLKEKEIANTRIAQQQAELKAKRNIQYALFGGLALVIVFSIFMYNRFKVTKKQNLIIEEQKREVHLQKDIIEEKHKEITDSINYAERIQRSFLASKAFLDKNLNDYFVLFEPKEVVSGDFYWASTLNNGNFVIACADSTGHGVPGAIMSILNISALEKSIEQLNQPDEILNHTRKVIIDRLKNDGSEDGGKDGMDVSLLVLNKERNKLIYSAANNPIWILRNGQIIELSPDKMPVGKHDHDSVPFKKHEIDILKGDIIYSLTDGMPDQFGGQKGKKYKYNHLKSFLVSIVHLNMIEQRKSILNEFYTWKGDLEQTDDVTIVGIKI